MVIMDPHYTGRPKTPMAWSIACFAIIYVLTVWFFGWGPAGMVALAWAVRSFLDPVQP